MVDLTVPEDVQSVIASLHKFIEAEVIPLEKKLSTVLNNERFLYDENGLYTKEVQNALKTIRMKSAEAGFFNMFGPAELGGMGDEFGPVSVALIFESITKKYGNNLLVQEVFPPGLFTGGSTPVLLGMQEEVREKVMPEIISGEKLLCFGLSESDAGSDVRNIKTTAVKDGEEWVINGTKQWITNAPYADYAIIFAVTNADLVAKKQGGISCFLVPIDGETCACSSVIPYLGHIGSRIGIISMENARVHQSFMIGEQDDAFGRALQGVDIGRVVMAAQCIGTAQWGLDKALEYAQQRKTFGKTIGENQMIQQMLADCAIDIYAARNMVLHCAWKMEQQTTLPVREISMIKVFTTEMVQRVLDKCMQIHGGMGLTNEMELEGAWRWARSMRIPDGTSEIQRRTVARRLLKGDKDLSR